MRWAPTLLALAATGALQVNALDATILTFPSGSGGASNTVPRQQTVSEKEARLVLKLRMQSSVASVLGAVDADAVDRLNRLAEAESVLFGGYGGDQSAGKSIVILEGVDQQSELQNSQASHVLVSHVSSRFINADLLESFSGSGDRGHYCAHDDDARVASTKARSLQGCLSQDPLFVGQSDLFSHDALAMIDSVEDWTSEDRRNSVLKLSLKSTGDSVTALGLLETLLSHLTDSPSTRNRDITAVILPPGQESTTLRRRGAQTSRSATGHQNVLKRSTQDPSLPSTLAPVCHASNSSCAEATNNCSGHGSCYLKFGTGVEGGTGNCYACQCQQSVVRNSDGTTKTVQWGGSACQKKDISSPFFLVAGVSLLAVTLVGSAIGMLFSMGAQELPSVISAGVGGPKNQM